MAAGKLDALFDEGASSWLPQALDQGFTILSLSESTMQKLEAQGWTCVEFLPANRWSCFNPGTGRPFPGNPDPRPSYTFLGFDRTSGDFLYTGHLIRQDLYSGQPCAPGGEPYVFRAPIGYYECVHA